MCGASGRANAVLVVRSDILEFLKHKNSNPEDEPRFARNYVYRAAWVTDVPNIYIIYTIRAQLYC